MKINRMMKGALIAVLIFGYAAAAWSVEAVSTAKSAQEAVGGEAIVSIIDSEKVTLQSTLDPTKTCIVPLNGSEETLKVGDKVKVEGNMLTKLEVETDTPAQLQEPEGATTATP